MMLERSLMTSLAPFIPSSLNVVRRMLSLAKTQQDDVVYDLGCGDGRVLFTAIHDFGVNTAVGYELNQHLVETMRRKIEKEKLESRITIYQQDLIDANISEATVIFLYLTAFGNDRLRTKLSTEAKSGTRIVSHYFTFTGWQYVKQDYFRGYTLNLYTIPEAFQPTVDKF
jgi:16S rRNA A1518/A1519 N6-dimethyltransferase RsmA/KsgA/DIM1 with predicted DNA glycosylase/AP lyase activity